MATRDTGTGAVLEQMVLPALTSGGYTYETQVVIGQRPGGRRHKVDVLATAADTTKLLVSLKWQQVSGTAEQKVPFEVICLAEAIRSGEWDRAYLVLGGEGWTLRDFYTSGGLQKHLQHEPDVAIITLEGFVARANRSEL